MRNCLPVLAVFSALAVAAHAAQLKFDAPAGWQSRTPSSAMRVAEFVLPRAEGDRADGSLTLYFFGSGSGGGAQANVDRWISQMTQPDGRPSAEAAKTESRKSRAGLGLTVVDVAGTYVAEITPGSSERFNEPGYRLIAAVVDTPGGAHYVKAIGPAATIARWQTSIGSFLESLRVE